MLPRSRLERLMINGRRVLGHAEQLLLTLQRKSHQFSVQRGLAHVVLIDVSRKSDGRPSETGPSGTCGARASLFRPGSGANAHAGSTR